MTHRSLWHLLVVCLSAPALLIAPAGCSDSDDDPAVSESTLNTLLSGEYGIIDYSGAPWAGYTDITFDGAGNGTFTRVYSSDDTLPSGSFTYTVDTEGMLTSSVNGEPVYGMVSADGSSFTMVNPAGDINVTIGIRKSSGMSAAALSGEYGVIDYSGVPWAGYTDITFDGAGNGTFARVYSSDGELPSGSFPYAVSTEGMLTSSVDGFSVYGMVSPDGSSFGMVHPAGDINITFGILKTQ